MNKKWPDKQGWDDLDYMVTVFAEACGVEALVKEKDEYLTFKIIGKKTLPYHQQRAFEILKGHFEDSSEQHTLDWVSQHLAAAQGNKR